MHLYTSRAVGSQRHAMVPMLVVLVLTAWYTLAPMVAASAATSVISGVVFEDLDRDGTVDAGEPRWEGKGVWVMSPDGSQFVASGVTDASGRYEVGGLPAGTYLVRYHPTSWRDVRDSWVPTTTAGVWPEQQLSVDGAGTFDLGWRQISTSEDWSAPLTTYEGSSGVLIESFTDAVTAADVHEALLSGSLLGPELALTSIQFGHPSTGFSSCKHSVSGTAGSFDNFSAACNIDYDDWVTTRHHRLFHEYGHAWSRYHQKVVNQWDDLDAYLVARGVDPADSRLASTHAWLPGEMIAEDFRTLFGSPAARAYAHENQDVPPASEVEGLAAWLSSTFMGDTGSTPPQPEAEPDEAPVVEAFTPADGATVSGIVEVAVRASDDMTAASALGVEIVVDGAARPAIFDAGSGSWQASLDSTTLPDGQAVVEARVTDGGGNTTTVRSTVTVDNGSTEPGGDASPSPEPSPSDGLTVTTGTVNGGGTWIAWLDARVHADGAAVEGATVQVEWVGEGRHGSSGQRSCITSADGACRVEVEQPKRVASVTFTVIAPDAATATVGKP